MHAHLIKSKLFLLATFGSLNHATLSGSMNHRVCITVQLMAPWWPLKVIDLVDVKRDVERPLKEPDTLSETIFGYWMNLLFSFWFCLFLWPDVHRHLPIVASSGARSLPGNAFFVEGRGKMTDKVPRPSKSSIFYSNGRWWRRWLLFLSEGIPSWFSRWWRWLPTRDLGWRRSSRLVEDIRQPQSETWLSTSLMWLFEVGTTSFVCVIYDDKVLF